MFTREPETIIEAIDTLTAIAELEDWGEGMALMVIPDEELFEMTPDQRTIRWLQEHDGEQTIALVQRLFGMVHDYLKWASDHSVSDEQKLRAFRGVTTVMAVVGEAAQKLDRFAVEFFGARPGTIVSLDEYKELQHFYLERVAPKERHEKAVPGTYVPRPDIDQMNEIEKVRSDLDYELFHILTEEGKSYISPTLRKSVQLACDFGAQLDVYTGDDPLVWVQVWQDETQQRMANDMLRMIEPMMRQYYEHRTDQPKTDLSTALDYTLMALMLAANKQNLLIHYPKKAAYSYFSNFQHFLRTALKTKEYYDILGQPGGQEASWPLFLRDLAHAICFALYTHGWRSREVLNVVHSLIRDGACTEHYWKEASALDSQLPLTKRLREEYLALNESLQRHPNGPLYKVIDLIREERKPFDPMMSGNIPGRLFDFTIDNSTMTCLRLPAPVCQDTIDRAPIIEEFRGFLRANSYAGQKRSHLLINLQDRTAWREKARARVLERLERNREFSHLLTTVTFAIDTPFYHQSAPFDRDMDVDAFFAAYDTVLHDENSGYYFPDFVRQALFPAFGEEAMHAIHKLFFDSKQILTRGERQQFIDIFHILLTLKLLDISKPDTWSFTDKDGVDTSMTYATGLFVAMRILKEEGIRPDEFMLLRSILHIPALLMRERTVSEHRFERMVRMLERLESKTRLLSAEGRRNQIEKELAPLYHSSILDAYFTH